MVELADADGSGDIDFVEFVTLMAHKMQDDKSKGEGDEDERLKSAFAVFVRLRSRMHSNSVGDHTRPERRPPMRRIGLTTARGPCRFGEAWAAPWAER